MIVATVSRQTKANASLWVSESQQWHSGKPPSNRVETGSNSTSEVNIQIRNLRFFFHSASNSCAPVKLACDLWSQARAPQCLREVGEFCGKTFLLTHEKL